MAVIKASFTRSPGAAKAYVRYISHRPGKDGERTTRELFGIDGRLSKLQAYQLIDRGGRGTRFYRIALSPDPRKEDRLKDLDLREITEQTMMQLQARLQDRLTGTAIQFLAAIHADHTAVRHVHILALIPGKLGREDLATLRQVATEAALSKRQERDRHQAQARRDAPRHGRSRLSKRDTSWERGFRGPARARPTGPTCPNCGPWSLMERRGRLFECPSCGLAVSRAATLSHGIEPEGGLGVSLGEGGHE
jgi:hypothetical protein